MSQGDSKESYKYSDITGKVIGCAMEVHRYLGNGFQESRTRSGWMLRFHQGTPFQQ